jgi:hypothetical protein
MENEPAPDPPEGQLLIYQDGALRVQVRIDGTTVWLTQRLMAELYQVSVKTINEHLVNIYAEHELNPSATIRKFRIVQTEGTRQVSRMMAMYLDLAEDQARRRKPMYMADWVKKLDAFLAFNERDILMHAGKVSQALAEEHAHAEFEKYEAERRRIEATIPTSDFDQFVEKTKQMIENEESLPKIEESARGNRERKE